MFPEEEGSQWKNVKAKTYISAKPDFQREKRMFANSSLEKRQVFQSKTTVGKRSCILWKVYVMLQNDKVSSSRVISGNDRLKLA